MCSTPLEYVIPTYLLNLKIGQVIYFTITTPLTCQPVNQKLRQRVYIYNKVFLPTKKP